MVEIGSFSLKGKFFFYGFHKSQWSRWWCVCFPPSQKRCCCCLCPVKSALGLQRACPWERCLVRWKHGHFCPLCQALWGEPHWRWGGELQGRTRTLQGVRSSGVAQFPICQHQGPPVWVHMCESKSHSYLGMLNLYNALARASWKRACVFFSCSYECE